MSLKYFVLHYFWSSLDSLVSSIGSNLLGFAGGKLNFNEVLVESSNRIAALATNEVFISNLTAAGNALVECLESGNKIISCGNGGSMCDAIHFAEEFSGRYREDRKPLRALSISDPGYLSCTANDFGYEQVFSRFVEGFADTGDVLVAISTSGKSPNVVKAAEMMISKGGVVIALTGSQNTLLEKVSTITLAVGESKWADRIQESHIVLIHTLVEYVESKINLHRLENS